MATQETIRIPVIGSSNLPFNDEDLHPFLLARVKNPGESEQIAGIKAVIEDGAPMMDWVTKSEAGIIYPSPGRKVGYLAVSHILPVREFVSEFDDAEELLKLPELDFVDSLDWQPASCVVGVMKWRKQAALAHYLR